jgi:hypothetical protein
VDDSFANGQRNGAHDSTLPPRAQFVKLHVLWKCSKYNCTSSSGSSWPLSKNNQRLSCWAA